MAGGHVREDGEGAEREGEDAEPGSMIRRELGRRDVVLLALDAGQELLGVEGDGVARGHVREDGEGAERESEDAELLVEGELREKAHVGLLLRRRPGGHLLLDPGRAHEAEDGHEHDAEDEDAVRDPEDLGQGLRAEVARGVEPLDERERQGEGRASPRRSRGRRRGRRPCRWRSRRSRCRGSSRRPRSRRRGGGLPPPARPSTSGRGRRARGPGSRPRTRYVTPSIAVTIAVNITLKTARSFR